RKVSQLRTSDRRPAAVDRDYGVHPIPHAIHGFRRRIVRATELPDAKRSFLPGRKWCDCIYPFRNQSRWDWKRASIHLSRAPDRAIATRPERGIPHLRYHQTNKLRRPRLWLSLRNHTEPIPWFLYAATSAGNDWHGRWNSSARADRSTPA